MLFTTPEQFVVLGVLLLGGWLLGYASAPGTKKWKRRVREQSDSFTAYHAEAEDRARAANQRAADLQGELEAVRADHAEAERTIVALRAAAAPVAAVVAERPALRVVEPEPTREIVAEPVPAEITPMSDDHATRREVHPVPALVPAAPATSEPVHSEAVAAEPSAPEKNAVTDPEPQHPRPAIEDAVFEPVAPVPMTPTATEAPPAPIGPAEPEMPSTGWFASSARDDLTRIRGIDGVLNTRLFGLGVVRFEDIEMLSAEDEMALEERLALPVGSIARDQWRTQAALLRAGQNDEHAAQFAPVQPAPVA